MMATQRASVLGHVQRSGSVFGRNISVPQVITIGAGLVLVISLGLLTSNGLVIIATGLLTAIAYRLVGRTTVEGDSWIGTRIASVSATRETRKGRAGWSRDNGLPAGL